MNRKIISYNPRLKKLAKELRNNSTKSEIILWQYLKGKQRLGYDFHRQKPIDNFIVDFYCCDLKLGIELDGLTHTYENTIEKDRIKEDRLISLGIVLLRFEDDLVFKQIDWIIEKVDETIMILSHANTSKKGDYIHQFIS